MLSDEMKAERVRISRRLLQRSGKEGEDFLKTIAGDETWVHHDDPASKRQSMEYSHKESPQPKNSKHRLRLERSCCLVLWNSGRVVLVDFLEKQRTINSQRYIEPLTALTFWRRTFFFKS